MSSFPVSAPMVFPLPPRGAKAVSCFNANGFFFFLMASGRYSWQVLMCLNLSTSNLDPCNITEVYKPNLAAGENEQKGISIFFVLALEAGGRYDLPFRERTRTLPVCSWTFTTRVPVGLVAQSCLTLCGPMDCSLPLFSVRGVFQVRILEWVAISYSGGSSGPRDQTRVFCVSWIGRWILHRYCHREAQVYYSVCISVPVSGMCAYFNLYKLY